MRKKLMIAAGSLAMLVVTAGVVLTTLALYKYGGPQGVADRVRMQFAAERLPDELYVPTPEESAEADANLTGLGDLSGLPQPTPPTADANLTGLGDLSGLPQPTESAETPNALAGQLASLGDEPLTRVDEATPTAAPTATPTPTFAPSIRIEGLAHYWQTWNNCGPATLSANLSYFGIKIGQEKIGPVLKPERDDKNVGPEQLAQFAREQGLNALVRAQGDTNRLKALLAAGIPVLVETWYEPKPNDGMGHYRLIVGYDDAGKYWIAYDSYDSHGIKRGDPYQGIHLDYKSFDQLWKVFNRTYIPIYDDGRAAAVEAIIGADMDDRAMFERSITLNTAAVKANPKDNFAWFNLGSDYVALGYYEAAAKAYDTARKLKLPWRMLWYQFGPFEAYYNMGRHKEVIALADATIKTAVNDEELFYWKGWSQKELGDIAGAKASFSQAVKLRPSYQQAVDALAALPQDSQ